MVETVQNNACSNTNIKACCAMPILTDFDQSITYIHLIFVHPLSFITHHDSRVSFETLIGNLNVAGRIVNFYSNNFYASEKMYIINTML